MIAAVAAGAAAEVAVAETMAVASAAVGAMTVAAAVIRATPISAAAIGAGAGEAVDTVVAAVAAAVEPEVPLFRTLAGRISMRPPRTNALNETTAGAGVVIAVAATGVAVDTVAAAGLPRRTSWVSMATCAQTSGSSETSLGPLRKRARDQL